ncbi:MAG: zinc dependent phospholipase C family protein [Coriobacteriales bacterium]|jgi:hypothetical protein|nr:zinc dependent phospholipase C family protein [Coriobacteriales bacterium]
MPALLTHNYFGTDVLARLGEELFPAHDDKAFAEELRRIFLLGNQGPDPFFFALRTPHLVASKRFGSRMHRERNGETIEALRRLVACLSEPTGSLLTAYLFGFLCHFTLDSTVHPFVYAQQHALCDAGVKGLDRRDGSIVHGQIEADLDMMMLFQRRGVSIRSYDYTRSVLKLSDKSLALLDVMYQALAHEVYAADLPHDAFSRGVKDMRLTISVLYSPRGIKRRVFGNLERLFRRHSLAQAMSPRADVGTTCDFDNHACDAWINPFTDAVSHASFAELYAEALEAACANIVALRDGEPVATITRGLDFEGAVARA